jgi:hypothetical protein
MPRITIYLNDSETDLKKMIKGLQKAKAEENPYYRRSESEIAKMVLEEALEKAFKKYAENTE